MKILNYLLHKQEDRSVNSTINHKDIGILHSLIGLLKNNKNEILFVKILTLIIVNTWLLIIFWKVLLINNVNMIGKNVAVTKMNTLLQPFFDFMNNHSTLVLTISSGLIMGGMWYLNNVGYINIGTLLTRLGIRIFTNTNNNNSNQIPQTLNTSPIVINNITPVENTRSIGQGFFRQLGVKVLELLEVFIENMKNKKQNYK